MEIKALMEHGVWSMVDLQQYYFGIRHTSLVSEEVTEVNGLSLPRVCV